MSEFDLLERGWIPVVRLDGRRDEVGVQEALAEAGRFARIEDESPLVTAALHRLLLAVLHRALRGPESPAVVAAMLGEGQFDSRAIDSYLDRWRPRWDLFGDPEAFMQVSSVGLVSEGRFPISKLAPDLATRNNPTLFDHSHEGQKHPFPAARAARLLVGAQAFALTDGKSALAHAKDSPIGRNAVAVALGRTLFETLCLNLVPYSEESAEEDAPAWEVPALTCEYLKAGPGRYPRGLADKYTWQSRAYRLIPDPASGGVLEIFRASGEAARVAPDGEVGSWVDDPMVAYRQSEEAGLRGVRLSEGRAFWRDLHALYPPGEGKKDEPPRVLRHAAEVRALRDVFSPIQPALVAGLVAESGNPKILFWRQEVFPLPVSLFGDGVEAETARHAVAHCLNLAELGGVALERAGFALARELIASVAERKVQRADASKLWQSLAGESAYWSELEVRFPAVLEGLAESPAREGGVRERWRGQVRRASKRALWRAEAAASTTGRALRATAFARGVLAAELIKAGIPDQKSGVEATGGTA